MSMNTRRGVGTGVLLTGLVAAGAGLAATPSSAVPKPVVAVAAAKEPDVRIASVSTGGMPANDDSSQAVISADGKYVAFSSRAANLVPGDTNGTSDVFVRDLKRGLTRRVSVDTAGEQAVGTWAGAEAISKDGRYVLFGADAGNLVLDDTNGSPDLFVHDLRHGITTLVSRAPDGTQFAGLAVHGGISRDGRYVVFTTSCQCAGLTAEDVYVRDLKKGTTVRVDVASDGTPSNGAGAGGAISADGRYVVFSSTGTNLVPDDTNGASDVFRHDRKTGVTIRVSVGPGGAQGTGAHPGSDSPSVSADGRRVAFWSSADGLVAGPHGARDVYVRDVGAGATSVASPAVGGAASNGALDATSFTPRISGDGRYVTFLSWATNLVPDDTNDVADVFLRDLKKGTTRRLLTAAVPGPNLAPDGYDLVLDRDGDHAAFSSTQSDLVPGDANDRRDVFVMRLK
jgi:TolB protein